jgi:hypothetical protein
MVSNCNLDGNFQSCSSSLPSYAESAGSLVTQKARVDRAAGARTAASIATFALPNLGNFPIFAA